MSGDKEDPALWHSREFLYRGIISENHGTTGLVDTIDSAVYANKSVHSYTRIRRPNGCVGVYETGALMKWAEINPVDPQTREDISFQIPRIKQKMEWSAKYSHLKAGDITSEFKMSILRKHILNPGDRETTELARAFVDLATFDLCGYIHKDLKLEDTMKVAGNGWLLRKSSLHGSSRLKKNTRVAVLATGEYMVRIVEADGMGVLFYSGDQVVEPLELKKTTVFVCLIDAIKSFVSTKRDLIVPIKLESRSQESTSGVCCRE